MCYYKLYYGSQVWLLSTLKEPLFKKLLSQSGQCLKIINHEMSYNNLHILKSNAKIILALPNCSYIHERNELACDIMSDRRIVYLTFVRSNNYKVGLNYLSLILSATIGVKLYHKYFHVLLKRYV